MIGVVDRERSAAVDAVRSGAQFGEQGWRCLLPELGLVLETLPPESGLQAQPILTDAKRAKVILEQGMRAGSSALADIRIERCMPSVARSKRNRCTVVYRLEYALEAAGRDWPQVVVAKTCAKCCDCRHNSALDKAHGRLRPDRSGNENRPHIDWRPLSLGRCGWCCRSWFRW